MTAHASRRRFAPPPLDRRRLPLLQGKRPALTKDRSEHPFVKSDQVAKHGACQHHLHRSVDRFLSYFVPHVASLMRLVSWAEKKSAGGYRLWQSPTKPRLGPDLFGQQRPLHQIGAAARLAGLKLRSARLIAAFRRQEKECSIVRLLDHPVVATRAAPSASSIGTRNEIHSMRRAEDLIHCLIMISPIEEA